MNIFEVVKERLKNSKEKYRIYDDIIILLQVIFTILYFICRYLKGNVTFFYDFESSVNKYKNNIAIKYAQCIIRKGRKSDEKISDYKDRFELKTYTYQEAYDIIIKLSYILKTKYSIKEGSYVGIFILNKPIFIFIWFALWKINAIAVLLNTNLKGNFIKKNFEHLEIKDVFVDKECSGEFISVHEEIEKINKCQIHYLDEQDFEEKIIKDSFPDDIEERLKSKSKIFFTTCSCLIFTSGTTGTAKPVIISWLKIFLTSTLFGYVNKITKKSNVFTSMPLYHSTASLLGVCPALANGGCISLSKKFSTSTFWYEIYLCDPTHMQYVGEVCRFLLNSKDSPYQTKHNIIYAYGNGLRADVWADFKKKFNVKYIIEFYGSSESPFILTNFQKDERSLGACRAYGSIINFILSFQQSIIKIDLNSADNLWRDPISNFCKITKDNEPGELIINLDFLFLGKCFFQGYFDDPKSSNKKILRNVFKTGDLWYRSGDLLRKNRDNFFFFVDRLGDTFRWKSENVSTSEVESVLLELDFIKDVVVVGVRVPNNDGRAGFAIINLFEGNNNIKTHDDLLNLIFDNLSHSLPRFSIPLFLKFDLVSFSNNYKYLKNVYKNQKFPDGENHDEIIYVLKDGNYEKLTSSYWNSIVSNKVKL